MVTTGQSNNNNQGATGRSPTNPPLKLHCCIKWWNQVISKGMKGAHRQKILNIFKQIQKIDRTMAFYRFYLTNKNAPMQSYPPLNGKIKLPPNPTGMCQYCQGQPPLDQPGYMTIQIYLGHTKTLAEILAQITKYMTDEQVQIMLTPIQDKKAQEICWLVYTTKNLHYEDLAKAISTTIRIPTACTHFKQISSG